MADLNSWEDDPAAQDDRLARQAQQQLNLNQQQQQQYRAAGMGSFQPGASSFQPGASTFMPGQSYTPQYQQQQYYQQGFYPQYGQQGGGYNQGYGGYPQGTYRGYGVCLEHADAPRL